MFCLLVELSVLAKLLARKSHLRKPNRGDFICLYILYIFLYINKYKIYFIFYMCQITEGIISRKPRPNSVHDFLGLLYCFIVLLCICVVSCPYVTYFLTVMVQYGLFVLKVLSNPKQTNYSSVWSWLRGTGLYCATYCTKSASLFATVTNMSQIGGVKKVSANWYFTCGACEPLNGKCTSL